jgi:hypothetical protein
MSASFSQRIGAVPAAKAMQSESMDADLRSHLWSVMVIYIWANYPDQYLAYFRQTNFYPMVAQLYMNHFKRPIDEIEDYFPSVLKKLKLHFMGAEWHIAYSFLEFIGAFYPNSDREEFISRCNHVLELENSAYRFVDGKLAEIQSKDEIEEIETAIGVAGQFSGVKGHLQTALGFLTDRKNPDYRNSIKESISAVESLARHITGDQKATLGAALNVMEKKHRLEPTVKAAFSKLYGYTNDADGIRHSSMEDASTVTKADARFMLICCSAFVNFVIDGTRD